MANEKNDISEVVKKCKILLLDIEGTTTSISFVKDKLFPYAEENVKDFLDNEWETESVKEAVAELRKLALEDEEKKIDGVVTIPAKDASKDEQIEALVKSVKWQMSSDRKVGPLKQLQGLIWKKGYDKGDIKGHVYDDVSPALELWRSVEGRKVYIYSSGSVQAQKLLFGMSSAGDMLKLIDGHFDTAVGAKQEASSYTNIAEKIGCKAEEIVFLTDIDKEAEAARSAGVQAALVSREGNAPLSEAITTSFPVLYSFTELTATKKRKPDDQDEQQPAKVPKTDTETDVKTPIETMVKDSPQPITTPPIDATTEKMDVEEETLSEELPSVEETSAEQPTKDTVDKIETTVEELTSSNGTSNLTISDAKPIITESTDIEQKDPETMETESAEVVNSGSASKENGDKNGAVPEETPIVITEIKDVTEDKENLGEVTEVIENLVPIIEEPAGQDMEDLQNVGEVLQKECDEILSKVQDVTNLDSMPLKPLHPIAEETMETENLDSNDIVDGILDSEQEIEMRKSSNIDPTAIQEISDTKVETEMVNIEKQETTDKSSDTAEELKEVQTKVSTPIEENIKASNVVEEKIKETSMAKEKVKETCTVEEQVNEASSIEEKVKDVSTVQETVKETSSVGEKVQETSSVGEKVQETSSVGEKVQETSSVGEMVKENSSTEEIVTKSSPEEQITESNEIETKNSNLSNEKDKESSIKEDNVKEICIATEKVKDSSVIEEKKAESNITHEIGKEDSTTGDKVVDSNVVAGEERNSSSSEIKTHENNIVDEVQTKTEEQKKTTQVEEIKMEISTPEIDNNKIEDEKKSVQKSETEKMEIEDTKLDSQKLTTEQVSSETPAKKLSEDSSMETDQETPVETKESEKVSTTSPTEAVKSDSDTKETQLNGKATNGDTEMSDDMNGDVRKEDEICSRLSMENGKEVVNGANGDSTESAVKSENNGDDVTEVSDIKVKTVTTDEPRNDPIEQPMES